MIWWHRVVLKHAQTRTRVTVPMYDPGQGILVRCSCLKVWAL